VPALQQGVLAMIAKIYLIDAPLSPPQERRLQLVEAMANVLRQQRAYADRKDAIRALFWSGEFNSVDITHLVDDARQVAFQSTVDVVAKELGEP
jgi:hypothetical protein